MKLSVFIVCLWALGSQGYSVPESRILYGEKARVGQFPWQVALVTPYKCGGSLIHPNWILTAAHCVLFGDEVTVKFGDIDYYGPGVLQRSASKIIVHEKYNNDKKINDIALVYMDDPVQESDLIKIIKLSDPGDYVEGNELLTISGYGRTEIESNGELRYRDVYSLSNEECEKHWIPDNKRICTTGYSCSGDSGSPLVQWNGEEYIQVGIVSFGWCTPSKPSGYARTASYRDWIAENTNNAV